MPSLRNSRRQPPKRKKGAPHPPWLRSALPLSTFAEQHNRTTSLCRRWCREGRLTLDGKPRKSLAWKDPHGNWWIHPSAERPADERYVDVE